MRAKFISQNFIYPKVQLALAQLFQLLLQSRGRGVAVKRAQLMLKREVPALPQVRTELPGQT